MNRVLVIATAGPDVFAALVDDDHVTAERHALGGRGLVERLAGLVADVRTGAPPDLIAALVGPGSFTGIRAGLALAHGLSLGSSIPLVGVTVGEAVRHDLDWDGPLWVVTEAQPGRLFLEGDGPPRSVLVADLVPPADFPRLAGDGAARLAEHFQSRGMTPIIAPQARAGPVGVACAARARQGGRLPPLASLPLYIDAPQVSLPATPSRPPPA